MQTFASAMSAYSNWARGSRAAASASAPRTRQRSRWAEAAASVLSSGHGKKGPQRCKCGFWGAIGKSCVCGPLDVERYRSRLSGPLLDRIDIHIEVPAVPYQELSVERSGEPSAAIRERVNRARRIQLERFAKRRGVFANAHMTPKDLRIYCKVIDSADALLKTAIGRLKLSARAYHRVLKIARTIADLAESSTIEPAHVSEAVQYRTLDRAMA